jgi:hypothetical protein
MGHRNHQIPHKQNSRPAVPTLRRDPGGARLRGGLLRTPSPSQCRGETIPVREVWRENRGDGVSVARNCARVVMRVTPWRRTRRLAGFGILPRLPASVIPYSRQAPLRGGIRWNG